MPSQLCGASFVVVVVAVVVVAVVGDDLLDGMMEGERDETTTPQG